MINGLDLFSGIGGLSIALERWVKPLAYCEINAYCQALLLSRMADESICNAPVWDDIKTLDGNIFQGAVDIIYGGFPCQDISVAGAGKGLDGERSGLFYEILRLAKEVKPKYVFLENVPAITSRGGLEVVKEIASLGYDARWCVISAASVGALHRRERWFLLANAKHHGALAGEGGGIARECIASGEDSHITEKGIRSTERASCVSADVADTISPRCNAQPRGQPSGLQQEYPQPTHSGFEDDSDTLRESSQQADQSPLSIGTEWNTRRDNKSECWPFESVEHWQETVSSMGKCSDGLSYHVDRLRALGNAVVPIQAQEAFKILMGIQD